METPTFIELQPITIMSPSDKHYEAVKRAVKKYQDANRDVCRKRCRDWAKNLKTDPEKYRKYLDEKNEYMKKYRRSKKQEDIPAEDKGHNGPHPSHFV